VRFEDIREGRVFVVIQWQDNDLGLERKWVRSFDIECLEYINLFHATWWGDRIEKGVSVESLVQIGG